MIKIFRTISVILISLSLFNYPNSAFAKLYISSLHANSIKSDKPSTKTKSFIDADERGFISTDSSNSSSSKSSTAESQGSISSSIKNTINTKSKYKFQCGLAAVVIKNKVGYINRSGELVIPAVYDDGTMFYEDAAFVRKGEKWALIDNKGKLLTKYIFDSVDNTDSDYKDIEINDYHGLLNSNGELVVPPIYSGVLNVDSDSNISISTYDTLKKALVENLIGSINSGGEVNYNSLYTPFGSLSNSSVLPSLSSYISKRQFPSYDRAWSLGNGLYCVYNTSTNSYTVFDKSGKQVYTSTKK